MKHNSQIYRANTLLLTAVLLGSSGFVATSAGAADKKDGKSYFTQLLDGDIHLAPVGQRADLHMTFTSPSDNSDAFSAAHTDRPGGESGAIHLSVRMPWK